MRILILISGHLSTAPRPVKEATVLAEAGHDVEVRGIWYDDQSVAFDKELLGNVPFSFRPLLDLRKRVHRYRHGIRKYIRRTVNPESAWSWGTLEAEAMCWEGFRLKPDLAIAHSEAATWAVNKLSERGIPIGIDFEDWFTENSTMAPPAASLAQHRKIEAEVLHKSVYTLAPSTAMANAIAARYAVSPPTAVRNIFPESDANVAALASSKNPVSLHWFSQTIGPGRGLEKLFAALPLVTGDLQIHLRGIMHSRYRPWLDGIVPVAWKDKVFLHPTVSNADLPRYIAEHDIGLALEQTMPLSRDLTITNKFFQYMQAGLAVLATATEGQSEAFKEAGSPGILLPRNGDEPEQIAAALSRFIADRHFLDECRRSARKAAVECFNWESEKMKILGAIESAETKLKQKAAT